MRPALNPFVLSLKESATLAINIKARKLRQRGETIYHYGFGQSPFPVPEPLVQALRDHAASKDYLPTRGLPELCEAVAKYYREEFGYSFEESHVVVGPGSKELIFETIYLMEGPLMIPAPSWVSYGPQAALRGKQILPIITKRENSYRLTPEELDRACHSLGQQQKTLIMNNPGNPTGAVYRDDELRELAEICRAYQVVVISDEIYAKIDFTDNGHSSLVDHYPEGTIVTGGISKSFAAGGYRLGVMLIPDTLEIIMHSLKAVVSETFSAVSAPIQFAALEGYANYDGVREFVETTNRIHRAASRYLHKRFIAMGLNCPLPEGAFYLFPDFGNYREKLRARGALTGRKMCEMLLDQAKVAVLPASDFYLPSTNLGVRVASVDYDGGKVLANWSDGIVDSEEAMRETFPNLAEGCDSLERFLEKL